MAGSERGWAAEGPRSPGSALEGRASLLGGPRVHGTSALGPGRRAFRAPGGTWVVAPSGCRAPRPRARLVSAVHAGARRCGGQGRPSRSRCARARGPARPGSSPPSPQGPVHTLPRSPAGIASEAKTPKHLFLSAWTHPPAPHQPRAAANEAPGPPGGARGLHPKFLKGGGQAPRSAWVPSRTRWPGVGGGLRHGACVSTARGAWVALLVFPCVLCLCFKCVLLVSPGPPASRCDLYVFGGVRVP